MSMIEDDMRGRLAGFLPRALEMALASYRHVSIRKKDDVADIKKQHEACKVAVAHVELLLKLARRVDVMPQEDHAAEDEEMRGILEEARREIAGFEGGGEFAAGQ